MWRVVYTTAFELASFVIASAQEQRASRPDEGGGPCSRCRTRVAAPPGGVEYKIRIFTPRPNIDYKLRVSCVPRRRVVRCGDAARASATCASAARATIRAPAIRGKFFRQAAVFQLPVDA